MSTVELVPDSRSLEARRPRQPTAAAETGLVEMYRWTGSGYRKTVGHDLPEDGDVILRRRPRGRAEVYEANRDTSATLLLEARVHDRGQRGGVGEASARGTRPQSSHLTKPGVLSWPAVADAIAQLAEQAVADPHHPWTVRWPTSMEMAEQFGTTQTTILKALNYLHEQGVLVKALVTRPDGPKELWVPRVRALGLGSRPALDQIASEILTRGMSGEWAVLPSQYQLAEHFGVSRKTIHRVMQLLAERRQAVKLRVGGIHRWRIIPPHRVRTIDPRLTVAAPRVVVADLIARIRAGEFRYRLPDGTVHERPFLANSELIEQYGASAPTIAKIRKELLRLGWIVPGEQSNTHFRLAERVPPVDRSTHPAPRKPRKIQPQHKRARELADDLTARIRAGEFVRRPFPILVEVMATYNAGLFNARAALEELEREGWVEFRKAHRGRTAVLADPLPEQPDTRLATALESLDLTARTLNCLRRDGIATMRDLVARTEKDLLDIRNFGVKALEEVKLKLAALGIEAELPAGQTRAG